MIIAHEYQTLQSWHDLHGPLVQLLLLLLCSIILLLSSFCNLFCFSLLSNTFAHLNSLMTSFEQCFSYTSFFLLLSGLKISFEHRLFNNSFFLLLFGLKIRFETLHIACLKPVSFCCFLEPLQKENQSNSQVRWLHITFVSSSCSPRFQPRFISALMASINIRSQSWVLRDTKGGEVQSMRTNGYSSFYEFLYYSSITRYFTNLHSPNAQNCSQNKQNVLFVLLCTFIYKFSRVFTCFEFRPISGGFTFVLENVPAAGPISLMEYQNGQYPWP
jgi:hypothetical protein